jgi:predicted HAD superfamily Cof-like phosphohydrolase
MSNEETTNQAVTNFVDELNKPTVFDQVAEFHRAFGLPLFEEQTPADAKLSELRIRLLKEEYDELKKAVEEKDLVEIADALADMTYIICGTAHSYGITLNNGWEPEYYDFEQAPPEAIDEYPDEMNMHLVVLELLYEAYERYEKHHHYEGIQQSMFSMMMEIAALAYLCQIPFKKVFDEVHASNMTKLMPDGSVLRREDGKVIKPPHFRKPDLRAVIFGG